MSAIDITAGARRHVEADAGILPNSEALRQAAGDIPQIGKSSISYGPVVENHDRRWDRRPADAAARDHDANAPFPFLLRHMLFSDDDAAFQPGPGKTRAGEQSVQRVLDRERPVERRPIDSRDKVGWPSRIRLLPGATVLA